jgi:glycosyltransferase involved in cell wall biosynthesis
MKTSISIPFFSIIIPIFNLEKYIFRCLSSVLNQKFQDVEIIIINDGSTDNSVNIINDFYIQNPSKITVINHIKNESQHITRIDGVATAIGQYILFLDGDDYFTKDSLNVLYNIINHNPGYDIYEYGYIFQPSGHKILPSFTGNDRFFAYFQKSYPNHCVWNKVYTSKIKTAFLSMERKYFNYNEDLYESIVIAYYLTRNFKINRIITNYSFGQGLSTSHKNYNKIIDMINSVKTFIDLINIFLDKININIDIKYLIYFRIRDLVNAIFLLPDINEKIYLYQKLSDCFSTYEIVEYLMDREKIIINSLDYKLGKTVLYPLRKIKHLLKRLIFIFK